MRTRRFAAVLAFAAAVFGSGSTPATAQLPPSGSSDACGGYVVSVVRVDATHIAAYFRLECVYPYTPSRISVSGVISRTGVTTEPSPHFCYNTRTCTERVVAYDPGGTEKYWIVFDPDSYITFASAYGGVTYECLSSAAYQQPMTCQSRFSYF